MIVLGKSGRVCLGAFILILCLGVHSAYASPTVYDTGTTIYDVSKAYAGNVIYQSGTKVYLIDMDGTITHTWERPDYNLLYAKPLLNGNILVNAGTQNHNGSTVLMELDWDSNIVWEFHGHEIHHDFERLENGNTLILCTRKIIHLPISTKRIYDDYIIEVNPQGEIVWEWHSIDHFDELGLERSMKKQISNNGGDWAHTNSVQSLPDNTHGLSFLSEGNILVSQRHTGIIFIINKNTGSIAWKIGPVNNMTIGQHNANMIPVGSSYAGGIMVFDNGNSGDFYSPTDYRIYSRVLVIDPVTKEIQWEYNAEMSALPVGTFFSHALSGAEILPNGNTLIVEGLTGRLFQVTSTGEIVWEYISPFYYEVGAVMKNAVYRAHLVETSWGSN